MKIVWHKHNLIISSSVDSGHHNKYLCEIPHEYLSPSWEKLFQLNVNHLFNLGCFFQMTLSLLAYVRHFQGSFIFEETTSLHFFRVATSTQRLLFQSNYFSRIATIFEGFFFQKSYFFAAVTFSE